MTPADRIRALLATLDAAALRTLALALWELLIYCKPTNLRPEELADWVEAQAHHL